jgi:hypothetical protein
VLPGVASGGLQADTGRQTVDFSVSRHVSESDALREKNKIPRENPYGYVPVSEARAWRQELEERAMRQGVITQEELEGAKPDWHGDFPQWKDRKGRVGLGDWMERDGVTVLDLIKVLAGSVIGKKETRLHPQRARALSELRSGQCEGQ